MPGREQFTSHLTTILTMIGVSVGLGNVWRFPYMMGLYGGSAFLFIYLLATLLLAIPAVTAEWSMGRITRKGPIGAFSSATNPTIGHIIGFILIITVTVADSYYIVVIANVMTTAGYSISSGFDQGNNNHQTLLNHTGLQYGISLAILTLSIYIIIKGLNKGIEWISKFIVPFFLVLMLYLIAHALSLDNSYAQLLNFLKPDFNKVNMEVIFAALGQAFFSLGLGGTFLLTYGSYMRSDQNLMKGAILTGMGDVGAAVLAGIFIVPTILAFNLDLSSGPRLIFETLPQLFAVMPFGRVIGSLFLIGLILVAFLSNIAALEVVATSLCENKIFTINRKQTILALAFVEAILILPSAINPNLIGTLDLIFGSGMQTLGSGITILAVCWCFKRSRTLKEIVPQLDGTFYGRLFFFWLKWIIPITLIIILILYIIDAI